MDALTSLLAQHGLALVFVNVVIAQLGLPVPALPMLVVAGALVADGTISVIPLALVVMVGSLLGDTPWYFAGRRYGYRVLRTLCRISIEPDSCVKRTENIFARYGPPSLLLAKLIPGFSTAGPPLAGAMGLPLGRFLPYSAGAALIWATLPVSGGYFFRDEVEWLLVAIEELGTGAVAALATVLFANVAVKTFERYLLIRFLRTVRIGVDELHAMMAAGEAPVILDVRSTFAREAEPRTIPGAILADLDSAERVLSSVPPERDVIVYCS